jgi:hypothetical protein
LEAIADYLQLSNDSRQVLDAFGVEAPAVLNQYALQLEAMLDSAVAWGNRAANNIQGYAAFAVNEHQEKAKFFARGVGERDCTIQGTASLASLLYVGTGSRVRIIRLVYCQTSRRDTVD